MNINSNELRKALYDFYRNPPVTKNVTPIKNTVVKNRPTTKQEKK